jgi:hypothetical protein
MVSPKKEKDCGSFLLKIDYGRFVFKKRRLWSVFKKRDYGKVFKKNRFLMFPSRMFVILIIERFASPIFPLILPFYVLLFLPPQGKRCTIIPI